MPFVDVFKPVKSVDGRLVYDALLEDGDLFFQNPYALLQLIGFKLVKSIFKPFYRCAHRNILVIEYLELLVEVLVQTFEVVQSPTNRSHSDSRFARRASISGNRATTTAIRPTVSCKFSTFS